MSLGEIPGGNLRAYYKAENVNDSGPNGFNLTNRNTVVFNSGKFSKAADYGSTDGSKALEYGANILSGINPTNWFFSFWYQLNSTSNISDRQVININTKNNTPTTGINLRLRYSISGSIMTWDINLTGGSVTFNVNVDTDWHWFQMSKLGSEFSMIIDGDRSNFGTGSRSYSSSTAIPSVFLSVGNGRDASSSVQSLMKIDELFFDEGIYIQSERLGHKYRYYTQTKGRFCI